MRLDTRFFWLLFFAVSLVRTIEATESLWLEAEHFDGVRGYCWPMGSDKRKMRETDGRWGLSGPGWAAEWNQGGESGFLSIATGAADDKAAVTRTVEIPNEGTYHVWVRYGDWREQTERFQIQIEQNGAPAWTARFGEQPIVEEDNVMKLYWGWAFVWDGNNVSLKKGPAKISLLSTTKGPQPRQVDVVVLTTDDDYRPRIKDRPTNPAWQLLETWRGGIPTELEPLARRAAPSELPESWRTRTFRDGEFLYLWNVSHAKPLETWLSDKADRVKFPYNVIDKETREEFEA